MRQQQVTVFHKAMENKKLSPRLAGECFRHIHTVYWHVAKKYAKFGAGRLAVGAVLVEVAQKSIV